MSYLHLENRMISRIGYIPWVKCCDDMSASTWEYVAEIQGQERSLGKLTTIKLWRQGLVIRTLPFVVSPNNHHSGDY